MTAAVALGAIAASACTGSANGGDDASAQEEAREAASLAADWLVVDDDCGGPDLVAGGIEPLGAGPALVETLGDGVDLDTVTWWVPFDDLRTGATADDVVVRDVSSGFDRFVAASVGVSDPRLAAWDPAGDPRWAGDFDGWELLDHGGRFALLLRDDTIMAVDQADGSVAACYERRDGSPAHDGGTPPVALDGSLLAAGLGVGGGEPLRLTRLDVSTTDLGVSWSSEHEPGADVLHVGSELSTWVLPRLPADPAEGTVWLRRLDDDTGGTAWERRLGPAGVDLTEGRSVGVDDPLLSVDHRVVWSEALSDRLLLAVEERDGTLRLVVVSEDLAWVAGTLTARPTAAVGALGVTISLADGSAVGIDLTGERRWQTPGVRLLGPDAPFLPPEDLSGGEDVAAQLMVDSVPPAFVDVESGRVTTWEPLAWTDPTTVTGTGDTLIGAQAAVLVEPATGLVAVELPSAGELVRGAGRSAP